MSQYPCDVHGRRYFGAQETAYLALVRGTNRLSRRLRLCPTDMEHLLDLDGHGWVSTESDDAPSAEPVCSSCGRDTEAETPAWAFFATVYRRKSDRVDYFGEYCVDCALILAAKYGLVAENGP